MTTTKTRRTLINRLSRLVLLDISLGRYPGKQYSELHQHLHTLTTRQLMRELRAAHTLDPFLAVHHYMNKGGRALRAQALRAISGAHRLN